MQSFARSDNHLLAWIRTKFGNDGLTFSGCPVSCILLWKRRYVISGIWTWHATMPASGRVR